jgi:hypothetical protein
VEKELKRGEDLFQRGDVNAARECFLALTDCSVSSKEAYNNLGVIAFEEGQYDEALNYFTEALAIDPSYEDAKVNFTRLLETIELSRSGGTSGSDKKEISLPRYRQNRDSNRITRRGYKVALVSRHDFAGSAYRLAQATNLYSCHSVIPITILPVSFPAQMPRLPSYAKAVENADANYHIHKEDIDRMQAIIDDSDIIHFKGDDPPSEDFIPGVKITRAKPWIVTVSGSFFRRGDDPCARSLYDFNQYDADMKTVLTPDLAYPEFGARYWIPFAIDMANMKKTWRPSTPPIVCHMPSARNKKGTDILIEAVERLRADGHEIKLDIVEGVGYRESLGRKSLATVYVDQINSMGFYGNSSVEAMAQGIPVISYMSEDAVARMSSLGGYGRCPVINAGSTVESLSECLRDLHESESLSRESYAWCMRVHDYSSVGVLMDGIYRELMEG